MIVPATAAGAQTASATAACQAVRHAEETAALAAAVPTASGVEALARAVAEECPAWAAREADLAAEAEAAEAEAAEVDDASTGGEL